MGGGGGAQKSLHLACINGPAVGKAEGFKCVAVVAQRGHLSRCHGGLGFVDFIFS